MVNDGTLLRDYAQTGSESAFSELVRRHMDLVYSTALRGVNGDESLAQDVCQAVFVDLARKARALVSRPVLGGWLYTSTCFAAAKAVRTERRRFAREQKAHSMQERTANSSSEHADWDSIRPVFDLVMLELKESDRQVLVERFFERRSFEEVGQHFGLTANAARMRVERAVDRLRDRLMRRGIRSSASALALVLTNQAIAAAPSGLAASITACTLSTAGATSSYSFLTTITMAKIKTAILGTLVAAGVAAPIVIQYQTNAQLRAELQVLRLEAATSARQQQQAASAQSAELERLRRENTELVRLRGEVATLRQSASRQKERGDAEARNKESKQLIEAEEAKILLAKSPEIPMIPAHQWANVGFASPASAYQTLNWAVVNRDTNAFSNALMWDAKAKERADALFAATPDSVRQRFGNVDGVIFDWFLNNSTPIAANRVLSQVNEGPNDSTLVEQHLYTDGRVRENTVQFARDENGSWRQVVPPELMPKLEVVLNNLSGPPSPGGK
jgi:RNA polymerase sigma factor (sigma-70 family)